jgi:hypothetical protein
MYMTGSHGSRTVQAARQPRGTCVINRGEREEREKHRVAGMPVERIREPWPILINIGLPSYQLVPVPWRFKLTAETI